MDPHHQRTKDLSMTQDDLCTSAIDMQHLTRSLWRMISREGSRNLLLKDTHKFFQLLFLLPWILNFYTASCLALYTQESG
jgi:hypothetical protein